MASHTMKIPPEFARVHVGSYFGLSCLAGDGQVELESYDDKGKRETIEVLGTDQVDQLIEQLQFMKWLAG